MTKYLSKFLLVFMLCLTILGSMVATAQAQTTVPGVTPTPNFAGFSITAYRRPDCIFAVDCIRYYIDRSI